jgi:hypothetical protein
MLTDAANAPKQYAAAFLCPRANSRLARKGAMIGEATRIATETNGGIASTQAAIATSTISPLIVKPCAGVTLPGLPAADRRPETLMFIDDDK